MTGQRKKNRNLIVATVIILVLAIILSSFIYLNSQKPFSGNVESITLGIYPSEYNSLIYLAESQKYFSANGLEIIFKNYASGNAAARGMLKGEADVSTASEFVVVNNAIQNQDICVFGSVSKYLNLYLVSRTDRGINSISDLSGKRIGVTMGTATQFFLGRYLDLNGIGLNQVTLVNCNFAETPSALSNGTVDSVLTFQPFLSQIQSLLGNRILVWPAQADQYGYFEAICTKSWATLHPDLIVRFLKALIQAENFNLNHESEAVAIISEELNFANSYTASVWSDYQYSVTLDQPFVLLMQDEARWLINNNLTDATSVPDFRNYVYSDGLKSAKPDSVNIIGIGD